MQRGHALPIKQNGDLLRSQKIANNPSKSPADLYFCRIPFPDKLNSTQVIEENSKTSFSFLLLPLITINIQDESNTGSFES